MPFDATLNLIALMLSGAMAAMYGGMLWWFASTSSHAQYRHWAAAWGAQGAYYLLSGAAFSLAVLQLGGTSTRVALSAAAQIASTGSALLLAIGAAAYARRPTGAGRVWLVTTVASVALGTIVAIASLGAEARLVRAIYRAAIMAAAALGSGLVIWRSRPASDRAGGLLGVLLIGFGLVHTHYLSYWLRAMMGRRPAYSITWLTLFDLLWIAAIATTMVAMGLADQRDATRDDRPTRDRAVA